MVLGLGQTRCIGLHGTHHKSGCQSPRSLKSIVGVSEIGVGAGSARKGKSEGAKGRGGGGGKVESSWSFGM